MNPINQRVAWITRTAVFIALLIALQWLTAGTQVFAGQYIIGTCVNCVLAVAALLGGMWSGIAVALVSPFCAFFLGIGPKLIQIVPCIALGNAVFVLCLYALLRNRNAALWRQTVGVVISATAKFAVLYIAVIRIVIPAMGAALAEKQVQTFSVMFSWPQLVTALLGGTAALLILPVLRKAIKQKD